jgi:hypothetical protein
MSVIRNALSALYSGDFVDITSSTDLVAGLPRVMDAALAKTPACPFRTFQDSLVDLARAVYALRLDGGRCTARGLPSGCGLYDPNALYVEPAVQPIAFSASTGELSGSIANSYGSAFIEVMLGASSRARPMTIEIRSARDGDASFAVQVWELFDEGRGRGPRPVPAQADGPARLGTMEPGERLAYTVPSIDLADVNRIALIITRVDANEGSDPVGEYTIRLQAE